MVAGSQEVYETLPDLVMKVSSYVSLSLFCARIIITEATDLFLFGIALPNASCLFNRPHARSHSSAAWTVLLRTLHLATCPTRPTNVSRDFCIVGHFDQNSSNDFHLNPRN